MEKRSCTACGARFTPAQRKDASPACSERCRVWLHRHGTAARKATHCQNCHGRLPSHRRKYCSASCAEAARCELNPKVELAERACADCGTPFVPIVANQVYCTRRCYRKVVNERYRPTYERECVVCGASFTANKDDAKYCSTGKGSCEASAKSVTYRVLNEPRRFDAARARLMAEPTRRELVSYRALLRRDPCSYCGALPSAGIDHIEPVSEGGADDWTNYAGCCRRCNATKRTLPLLSALLWLPASRRYHDLRRVIWRD